MSEYRAYNGKIDYDVDMWSNGDMYKSQYDSQRVYTNNIISSNTQNTYTVRDTTIDDQFEEQTQTIERYISAMEQLEEETTQTQDFVQETTQSEQAPQVQQVQQTAQVQQTQQVAQQTPQVQQTQQVAQQQAQVQQTQQYTTNQVQSLYNEQVDQAFNDIEVLS